MLQLYQNEQNIIYNTLNHQIKNNRISHAYLFDISNYDKGYEFVIEFIKNILCHDANSDKHDNNCPICNAIESGNYPDLVIINPDGQWIKKEQLDNLQVAFSTKSLLDNYKIYIINGAEYLNVSSANSILKFLEEPEEKIIAILLTKSMNNVLTTIRSRCQTFVFKNVNRDLNIEERILNYVFNSKEEKEKFLENNNFDIMVDKLFSFVTTLENKKINTLIYTYNTWFSVFKDKTQNIFGLTLMLLLYKDIVNVKINRKLDFFQNFYDKIKPIAEKNSIDELYKKIILISNAKEKNKININLALNIDDLIIRMEHIYD